MSSCASRFPAPQSGTKVLDLLRMFQDRHHLRSEQLASLLRITPQTLEEWFSEGVAPPTSFLALAVLFDTGSAGSAA